MTEEKGAFMEWPEVEKDDGFSGQWEIPEIASFVSYDDAVRARSYVNAMKGIKTEDLPRYREAFDGTVEALEKITKDGSCWNPNNFGGCGGGYGEEWCPFCNGKAALAKAKKVQGGGA